MDGSEEERSLFSRVTGLLRRRKEPPELPQKVYPPIRGGALPMAVEHGSIFKDDAREDLSVCLSEIQKRHGLKETVVDSPESFNELVEEIRRRSNWTSVPESKGRKPELAPLLVAINWSGVNEDAILAWRRDGEKYRPERLKGQQARFSDAEKFITRAALKTRLKEVFPPVFLEDSQPESHPSITLPASSEAGPEMFEGEESAWITDVTGRRVRPSEIIATYQHIRGVVPTEDPRVWYMADSGFEVLVAASRAQLDNIFFTSHQVPTSVLSGSDAQKLVGKT